MRRTGGGGHAALGALDLRGYAGRWTSRQRNLWRREEAAFAGNSAPVGSCGAVCRRADFRYVDLNSPRYTSDLTDPEPSSQDWTLSPRRMSCRLCAISLPTAGPSSFRSINPVTTSGRCLTTSCFWSRVVERHTRVRRPASSPISPSSGRNAHRISSTLPGSCHVYNLLTIQSTARLTSSSTPSRSTTILPSWKRRRKRRSMISLRTGARDKVHPRRRRRRPDENRASPAGLT